jgi:hypothetical protein
MAGACEKSAQDPPEVSILTVPGRGYCLPAQSGNAVPASKAFQNRPKAFS